MNTIDPKKLAEEAYSTLLAAISSQEVQYALSETADGRDRLTMAQAILASAQQELTSHPSISVALLGPSRHGKSTLLNAMASTSVLPTSDVRPCTAAIINLERAGNWGFEITFVNQESLMRDWKAAVDDAADYLNRNSSGRQRDEEADDPRYIQQTLSRFVDLLRVNSELPPRQLLSAVQTGVIPGDIAKLLGQTIAKDVESLDKLQKTLAKYLSTEDVLWTIVDSCTIKGPYPDWHNALKLVDVPGTNDTNTERARITNSMQENAKAVAIVTSDSNLGIDIQSWLRDSSVFANFLEARDGSYQRLVVIRSKFDSYIPEVEESDDEEAERQAIRAEIERHKREQTASFHKMLKDIASPLLPGGESEHEQSILKSRLSRIESIPVFFVSAIAHEVFSGRFSAGKKQKRNLQDLFGNSIDATGIPSLREYFNQLSDEFAGKSLYGDIAANCKEELGRLANYFQRQRQLVQAEAKGAGTQISSLVSNAKGSVIPWFKDEVQRQTVEFRNSTKEAGDSLRRRLQSIATNSERRFQDKYDKWDNLAWNTLRALGRKGGIHRTTNGRYLDINQDVCSVLVDELIIGWSAYRDEIVQTRLTAMSERVVQELCTRLSILSENIADEDVKLAIEQVISHLNSLTSEQREILLRQIESLVKELESIRQPAMEIITRHLEEIYDGLASERGAGCQQRMRDRLIHGVQNKLPVIRERITEMIDESLDKLLVSCASAMEEFGKQATRRLTDSLEEVKVSLEDSRKQTATLRLEKLDRAVGALPAPR